MISRCTEQFWKQPAGLPVHVQQSAGEAYQEWLTDPYARQLEFKQLSDNPPIYSVRIGYCFRALGRIDGDTILWFWIGTHEQYNNKI